MTRPFKILGVQQIAIGGPSKDALRKLWVDLLGVPAVGTFKSERENVDEDILSIAGVEIEGATARVTYTLTTPGCPMERTITQGVRAAAMAVEGIERVDTRIVWEPAWNPSMIAPTALT